MAAGISKQGLNTLTSLLRPQNHKDDAADTGGGSADAFTKDELRRLFQIESKTACATHDVSEPHSPSGCACFCGTDPALASLQCQLLGCDCQFEMLEDDEPAAPLKADRHLAEASQESSDEEQAYIGHPTKRPPPRKKSEARKVSLFFLLEGRSPLTSPAVRD